MVLFYSTDGPYSKFQKRKILNSQIENLKKLIEKIDKEVTLWNKSKEETLEEIKALEEEVKVLS